MGGADDGLPPPRSPLASRFCAVDAVVAEPALLPALVLDVDVVDVEADAVAACCCC